MEWCSPGLRAAIAVAAVLGAIGCATPAMRDPTVAIVPRRLIAVPARGVVWQWDAAGNVTIFQEGSAAAMSNLDDAIGQRLRLHGGRVIGRPEFEGFKWAEPFREWSGRMMREIMSERLGHAHVTHESVSDWRYGSALAEWRDRLGADFVLVSLFFDGRNTAGRLAKVGFGVGYIATRQAIACIVRLEDGRVVWCNLIELMSELLRPQGAEIAGNTLLLDLLGYPDGAGGMGAYPAPSAQPDTK